MQGIATPSLGLSLGIEEFSNLIKSTVNSKIRLNRVIQKEDLEQELTLKVLSSLKDLNEKGNDKGRSVAFARAKVILQNRIIDVYRYYGNRPDTGLDTQSYDERDVDPDDETEKRDTVHYTHFDRSLIHDIICYTDQTAFDYYSFKQLKHLIYEWVKTQDQDTRRFIRESIAPSKGYRNAGFKKNSQRSRLTYLKITPHKKLRILFNLATYLAKNGYENTIMDVYPGC